jgi:phosphate transport system substrate-binding protein
MKLILSIALLLGSLSAKAENLIKVDGSSTVFPITEAVSEEYQAFTKGATKVTVGVSGTGGGFKKFCRGETDVQNASRPITKEEMASCRTSKTNYFELPIAFDAIAIVVNTKNNWINEITTEELKKMWEPAAQGKIMTWKQVNAKWPDEKLTLFGASTDNGTFDYFTEAIVEKAKSSRGDYTASVDHNTRVMGVNSSKGALGYMPYSYYVSNKDKLKILGVIGGAKAPSKKAVLPNEKTVISGTYFPLSRPIFIYVNKAAMTRPEVKQYAEFYLDKAAELVKQVQYIPLPATAYTQAKEHLKKNKMGTVFGGEAQVGLTIEQILKKEATM